MNSITDIRFEGRNLKKLVDFAMRQDCISKPEHLAALSAIDVEHDFWIACTKPGLEGGFYYQSLVAEVDVADKLAKAFCHAGLLAVTDRKDGLYCPIPVEQRIDAFLGKEAEINKMLKSRHVPGILQGELF